MTLVATSYTTRDYLFFLFNLAIIAAYMALVVTMLFPRKILPIVEFIFSRRSRLAAAAFFVMASLTRGELSWSAVKENQLASCPNAVIDSHRVVCLVDISTSIVVFHILQAVTVWLMVIFIGIDLFRKFEIVREYEE